MIDLALFALGLLLGYFIGWARYKRVLMRIPNLGPLVINAILQKKMDEASDLMQQKATELVYDETNYGSMYEMVQPGRVIKATRPSDRILCSFCGKVFVLYDGHSCPGSERGNV